MPGRSDASLAVLLLTQRLVESDASPLKASEYWALLDSVTNPASLLGQDPSGIAESAGVTAEMAERVAQLLDAATAFAFQLDEAEQSGMHVVSSLDDDYPTRLIERLGKSAPPLLYLVGDPGLLQADLLGIVGSRDVSEAGAEVAEAAATMAVDQDYGVISGWAKGVDRLAMTAAVDAGGIAVGVLAESLARTARDSDVRRAITDGRLCLCTPYKPSAGFSVANAMGRNKLIYALSAATFVVSADLEKGGTWAGAVEALRHHIAPTIVWLGDGRGDGNQRLVERGGIAVDDIGKLFPLPQAEEISADAGADQLALEV
jgi:predicted Rossmann fold nucleotide-binding protein DprA/Smf involved in DNA uptake